ncbi:Inorganic phosphate transporter [Phaffia rhodozyma]|uniref:Inorganic phosphate transporter n=1 Tax=Phaffia rhodozyma TaxID=264483 RepID=A0A0F7SEH5_PHARH|nr:Inorganic phosphate transporter [Phaffia rhodozyma]
MPRSGGPVGNAQGYPLFSVEHNSLGAPITDEKGRPINNSTSSSSDSSNDGTLKEKGKPQEQDWQPSGVKTPMGVHELLVEEFFPADSYHNGTYWADLPRSGRVQFAFRQSTEEAKRELSVIGGMFKKDPLSPFSAYFSNYVVTGMGLFTEGATLFSIGNLKPLYAAVWPQCFSNHKVCSKGWINAIEYLEILGIICGQILVGFEGDWVGRRWGLVQDALIMTLGLVMLTASWGVDLNGWVICYGWCLFVYGIGVGGEYPMTSTSALEAKSGVSAEALTDDRLHRGRNVGLAFLMQGWGQLFNQVILIVLLIIFHHGSGNPPYSTLSVQWTFRVQFAVVGVMTLWLAYHRFYHGDYSVDRKLQNKKKKQGAVTGYDATSLKLAMGHFGGRMIGTCGTWFANDFFFYGNKLFQSTFISVLLPGKSTVMDGWLYNLINIGVSLAGYYLAAFLIDHKMYGRVRMQSVGFIMDFILILVAAAMYTDLIKPENIHGLQAIYYLSSFFNQFGPNSTTFLLAAEVYPTSIRATCHGLSAAAGKLGALAPAILYNYLADVRTKFWVVTWFGLLGFVLTVVFIPDTTGLDLREQERYWSFVRAGKAGEYHGIAVHKRHLSLWETMVLKRHLAYDPEKDRAAKMEELSETYARMLQEKLNEIPEDEQDDDNVVSSNVALFFQELDKKKRNAALRAAEEEVERLRLKETEEKNRRERTFEVSEL